MTELFLVLASAAWTLAVIRYAMPLGQRLGVLDVPGAQPHKAHAGPTPLVGGIACIPPVIVTLLIVSSLGEGRAHEMASAWSMAGAVFVTFLIGYFDDRRHIHAWKRLLLCGLVFAIALYFAPAFMVPALNFQTLGVKVDLGLLAAPFTILCLLALQNAVNMADGRNGLVIGMTVIWIAALLSYSNHFAMIYLTPFLAALALVLAANLRGRLFLGDAGTYAIGAFMGLMIIWLHHANVGLYTMDVVTIVLVPVADMIRLFVTRLARGGHPFEAGRDHLHHLLGDTWGWKRGRLIYWAMVAIPIVTMRTQVAPLWQSVCIGFLLYGLVFAAAHRRTVTKAVAINKPL
jgi:UDP-GlcNAc:undecaprenyl-phosphate GlcNAc-1-phosphate transferase